MNDDDTNNGDRGDSISGRSAALYFSQDPSLAQLLISHGIRVRDFILISFLSDQGPLTLIQLARVMNMGQASLLKSIKKLAAAGLVTRDPVTSDPEQESRVKLTSRGQDTANRINDQL